MPRQRASVHDPDPASPLRPEEAISSARPGGPRIIVGLGGSPFASTLLEAAHDFAQTSKGSWVAVHVETPYLLSPEAQQQVDADLTRARELGAEIVVTRELEVASALLRVARDQHATHILVGQTQASRMPGWKRSSLPEQLVRDGRQFTLHVLATDPQRSVRRPWRLAIEPASRWPEYGLVLAATATVTVAGLLLPLSSHVSIGLLYLLMVIVLSLWAGRWPVLLAGVLSALTWEYIFIPPRFAFAIATAEDGMLFGTYFVVALVAGQLTARIRTQAVNEHLREERARALLELTGILAEAPSFDGAVSAALHKLNGLFGASTTLLLSRESESTARPHEASGYHPAGADEEAVAWSLATGQPAGRFTPNCHDAGGYYLPLTVKRGPVGVLGVKLPNDQRLSLGQRDLIEAFARQLALLVEREQLRAASEREQLLAASERLHRSLFDSVSHELRTPLAVIDAAVDGLDEPDAARRERYVEEVRIAARRLNRLVRNLLDQSRLETGALRPRLDWCSIHDLVNAAVGGTRDALAEHPLEIAIPDNLPPVRADFALMEHAMMNLVLNAAFHTPPGTPISVRAEVVAGHARLSFADRGPGIPANLRERLFKKFTRGDGARTGGLGLGLSIVRGLVNAQGGEVTIGDNPGGGALVTIILPHLGTDAEAAHE
jgi:two-component system sensor histidine kinase KdpD